MDVWVDRWMDLNYSNAVHLPIQINVTNKVGLPYLQIQKKRTLWKGGGGLAYLLVNFNCVKNIINKCNGEKNSII